MDKQVHETKNRKFMGEKIRVVFIDKDMYVVLVDCFKILGRVDKDGNWNYSKEKVERYLKGINKIGDLKKFQVASKSKKKFANKTVEVDCLKIERLSSVITQFEPNKNKLEQLEMWYKFMEKVDELLEEAKLHRFLIEDKEHQKLISDAITRETDEKMVAINSNVCTLMAKILGVYPDIKRIKKEELKIYNANTTVDLMEVRQEVLNMYEQMLLMDMSKSEIHERILKFVKRKYDL